MKTFVCNIDKKHVENVVKYLNSAYPNCHFFTELEYSIYVISIHNDKEFIPESATVFYLRSAITALDVLRAT